MVFSGAKEGLTQVKPFADITIITGRNSPDVQLWKNSDMKDLADTVLELDKGSRSRLIQNFKEIYEKRIMLISDIPDGKAVAELNEIAFYPILAGHEEQSWKDFPETALSWKEKPYTGCSMRKAADFLMNLSGEESYG